MGAISKFIESVNGIYSYTELVSSLNKIDKNINGGKYGNRVGTDETNRYTKDDYNVDRFNDIIAYLKFPENTDKSMNIYTNPFDKNRTWSNPFDKNRTLSNGEELKIIYNNNNNDPYIRVSTSRKRKIELDWEKKDAGVCYDITYKLYGKTNTIYARKIGTQTFTNGSYKITVTNGELSCEGPGYFAQKFSTNGIPIYCYCTTKDAVWVGVKLDLIDLSLEWAKSGMDLMKDLSNKMQNSKSEHYSGWINVMSTSGGEFYSEWVTDGNGNSLAGDPNGNSNQSGTQMEDWEGNNEWDMDSDYTKYLYDSDMEYQKLFWENFYGDTMQQYSLRSHKSIIGLPLQFMGNVDMRVGSSTYGKQYMEDILYDMCIAIIKVGGPTINPKWDTDGVGDGNGGLISSVIDKMGKVFAYWDSLKEYGIKDTLKSYIFTFFRGNSARFYSFMSDYTHYTHYVNTLCHLFAHYLGIGDKTYVTANGEVRKYINYRDDLREIESDMGNSLFLQNGYDPAVYMYISDENSSLNRTFSNTTMSSQLESVMQTATDTVKEWGFFINAAGIEKGKGIANWTSDISNAISGHSNSFLGRLFGNAMEGVTTVLAGNNLSLPEIYQDSDTQVEHQFKVRLVSPYGDTESVFKYVFVPLARMLAFSLPRQYGPNSYQSPFIVQAFAKGLFNCQLGIVSSLSIQRCGNGGESHTINHIPTELDVNITVTDMYEKVFLSNEYFKNSELGQIFGGLVDWVTVGKDNIGDGAGSKLLQVRDTSTAMRLLFNNVGMIDFVASFCGYNLNQPNQLLQGWDLIKDIMKNRTNEIIDWTENDGWKFSKWEKQLNDSYHDAVTNLYTTMTLVN